MDDVELEALALASLPVDDDAMGIEWPSPLCAASDLSTTFSAGCDGSTTTSGALTTAKGSKRRRQQKDPNRARNERRLELVHLRQQAEELEGRLGRLRAGERRVECAVSDPPVECVVEAWRGIASDLASERQRTERENIRLRLLVDSHTRMTSQLKRIVLPKKPLYARADAAYLAENPAFVEASKALSFVDNTVGGEGSHMDGRASQRDSRLREPLSRTFKNVTHADEASARLDARMIDLLLRRVTRAREVIDEIFTANGLAVTEKAYRSAKVEQDEASGVNMELVASIVLPFDLEATQRVVWEHFGRTLPRMPDRTFFQYHDKIKDIDLIDPDDTDVATYSLELANGFVTAKFDEWRVMRRFVLPDRVIIIFCLLAEATEFASEPVEGIQVLEQAYFVLRRPGSTSFDAGGETLMQTCYHVQPVVNKPSARSERTIAQLTDFLFAFVAGTISVNHQMIERELERWSQ